MNTFGLRSLTMQKYPRALFRSIAFVVVVITFVVGCGVGGGGGGGSEPNDTGSLFAQLERTEVDLGNFTQVFVELNAINESGVILKLRYPTSITYSKRSAVLFPGEDEQAEIFPFTEATSSGERYLVFFFYPNERKNNDIRLAFNLKAISVDDEAFVEFGVNNNDPNVPDSSEFRVSRPLFSPIERFDVRIVGEAPPPTPTPRPTAATTPGAEATPTAAATTTPTPAAS